MHVTSVPAPLWRTCARAALVRAREPVLFVADALGESLEKVHALRECGFHHLYNSSCWWQFDSDWALVQHDQLQAIAPARLFPENHETPRLFHKTEAAHRVQHQRYLFAWLVLTALQIPWATITLQKPCTPWHHPASQSPAPPTSPRSSELQPHEPALAHARRRGACDGLEPAVVGHPDALEDRRRHEGLMYHQQGMDAARAVDGRGLRGVPSLFQ
jgi:hypothetical protein